VTGHRSGEGLFQEFYRDDGLLQGTNYQARWHAVSNQFCIEDYPLILDTRQNEWDCYSLVQAGDKLQWIGLGGELDGQGQILPGNAFGYLSNATGSRPK